MPFFIYLPVDAVLVGRDVVLLPEGLDEVALVRKAHSRADLLDRECGFTQQLLGMS